MTVREKRGFVVTGLVFTAQANAVLEGLARLSPTESELETDRNFFLVAVASRQDLQCYIFDFCHEISPSLHFLNQEGLRGETEGGPFGASIPICYTR